MAKTTFIFRSEDDRLAAEDRLRPIQETLDCVRTDGRRSISMTDPRYTELVRKVLNGSVGEGKYTECRSDGNPDRNGNDIINK
ncbi:MAG: hypothetical protein LUD72_01125 [Bacteroidales bacterium]|nr:hypothetical protein [Bacteroidales bacterium]